MGTLTVYYLYSVAVLMLISVSWDLSLTHCAGFIGPESAAVCDKRLKLF